MLTVLEPLPAAEPLLDEPPVDALLAPAPEPLLVLDEPPALATAWAACAKTLEIDDCDGVETGGGGVLPRLAAAAAPEPPSSPPSELPLRELPLLLPPSALLMALSNCLVCAFWFIVASRRDEKKFAKAFTWLAVLAAEACGGGVPCKGIGAAGSPELGVAGLDASACVALPMEGCELEA